MSSPKISIVIPTFNRGYILSKAIHSVQNQAFNSWELFVVDDGSTDNTKKTVQGFLSDKRIHYIYKRNKGASSARNEGLKRARGEYITYLDSDDILYPDYLTVAHKQLEKRLDKSFALVKAKRYLEFYDECGFLKASREENFEIKKPTLQDFYNWSIKASIGTGFIHRRKLNGTFRWNEDLKLLENLDFTMQLGFLDRNGFLYIPDELCEYRQRYGRDGLCSKASYKDWAEAFQKIYELHKHDPMMKSPSIYQNRIEKYMSLHKQCMQGKVVPPMYKFFPEFYKGKN
ncbi:MAG: hypothetical protein S4CHLAM6_02830 [Chlamydiae bacterium]|nr:hypothetical protein [Chlamydiota bacterium]